RQVGYGDGLADLHLAHDRRGRPGEPGAGAGLVRVAARLGTATGAGAGGTAGTIGLAQVHAAGEALAAIAVAGPGAGTLALAAATGALAGTRRGGLGVRDRRGDRLHRLFGRGLGGGFFLGLAAGGLLGLLLRPLGLLGAAAVGFLERLLLGQVALARLLELAQDLGTLVVPAGSRRRVGARGHQRDLLAHHHVDGGAVLAATDRQLLLAVAAEGDLARGGGLLGAGRALAVGPPQEAEQLDLLGAGDHLVGVAELHAGLGQLFQQLLDRRVHQCGQLADGGLLRHSVSVSCGASTAGAV